MNYYNILNKLTQKASDDPVLQMNTPVLNNGFFCSNQQKNPLSFHLYCRNQNWPNEVTQHQQPVGITSQWDHPFW